MLLGALLLAVAPGGALQDGPEEAWEAAVEVFVEDLRGLAEWCGAARLFAERDRAYEAILAFRPDDFDAHRGLKHRQLRDGSWVEDEDRKPSRNYDKGRLKECARRRSEITGRFRESALAAAEAAADAAVWRARVFDAVLRVDPDDAVVREALGEVRLDGVWVLEEVARGRERRRDLEALLADALAVATVGPASATDEEEAIGVAWTAAFATADLRVLTSGEADEAERLARTVDAAARLTRAALGARARFGRGETIYLLTSTAARDAFLAGCPDLGADPAELAGLSGTGLSDHRSARWDERPESRLDGAVRHGVARILNREYGLWLDPGWAFEGLGLYLTHRATGTRLTWYVSPVPSEDPAVEALRGRLGDPALDWLGEAHALVAAGRSTPLDVFLARGHAEMTVADVLVSNAFAAYLVEGRPEAVGKVLSRIGKGSSGPQAVADELGRPLPEVDERFRRWLAERAAPEPAGRGGGR